MLTRMRANMAAFYRLIGERSPNGRVFERDGLVAAIAPSSPDRSIVNGVVYDNREALVQARAELQAAYEAAGVRAWTVWVPEADAPAAEALRSAGHVLDGRPRAMTLDLAGADLAAGAAGIDWERSDDVAAVASINEEAYGLPAGEFAKVTSAFGGSAAILYVARVDGAAAACVGTLTVHGDCGVYLVATRPSLQRRGLAVALMRQALADARDAGATTSSLQATLQGQPVYERIGFRDHGAFDMWEWRGA